MASFSSASSPYIPSQFIRLAILYLRDLYNRVLVYAMPDNVREEHIHFSNVFAVAILGLPLSNCCQTRGLTDWQKSRLVNQQYHPLAISQDAIDAWKCPPYSVLVMRLRSAFCSRQQ